MDDTNTSSQGSSATQSLKAKLHARLEILRPVNCVIGSLTVIIGFLNGPVNLITALADLKNWFIILGGLVVYFITAGASNTINDFFDLSIDMVNRPNRPIPRGDISKEGAFRYFLILGGISIALSIVIGIFSPNPILIPFFNGFFLFIGYLYAWKGKTSGFPGNVMVGIAFSFGIPYGSLFITPINFIPSKIWFFFATSTLLLISRELVKGMEDIEGDKKFKIRTVANSKGLKTARNLSILFSTFAISSFTLPSIYIVTKTWFIIMVILGDIVVMASIILLIRDHESSKNQKYSSLMLKVGGFIGLITYIIASI
ncbi:MAG: geranylgeranylglycerol-phosphate geranylgeranyltransferase [Promethearchaeota archaeon]